MNLTLETEKIEQVLQTNKEIANIGKILQRVGKMNIANMRFWENKDLLGRNYLKLLLGMKTKEENET